MKTIKTAVSLPSETYQKAEKIRKKLGKSRSEMVAQALAKMIKEIEIRELEERYVAAYKAMPETPAEIAELGAWPLESPADRDEWGEPDASR